MKLYTIQALGPIPARYRGLLGVNDAEAIEKAKQRHYTAGFPMNGQQFQVAGAMTVVCGSVAESGPDTPHLVALTDGQLTEIEAALLDRIYHLEARIDIARKRQMPSLPIFEAQLKAVQSALNAVVSV